MVINNFMQKKTEICKGNVSLSRIENVMFCQTLPILKMQNIVTFCLQVYVTAHDKSNPKMLVIC